MEDLKPFTISKSIKNEPTVLLTEDDKRYTLWAPINDNVRIIQYLRSYMLSHFKINTFDTAKFTLRGSNYICFEEIEGTIELDTWQTYLWESKRKFNQFIQPKRLFEMFLFEAVFPLFGGVNKKYILPGKKNEIYYHPLPANNYTNFKFKPLSFSQLEISSPSYRLFFSYQKEMLNTVIDEFFSLIDEKFIFQAKHQLSLFPERRNEFWNELNKCFEPNFLKFTEATFRDYILHL